MLCSSIIIITFKTLKSQQGWNISAVSPATSLSPSWWPAWAWLEEAASLSIVFLRTLLPSATRLLLPSRVCNTTHYPGVFTRVTSLKPWILANTEGTQDSDC